ncbi:MAG: N-acetyl-gamma-glutamyl-phosphate reductase [Lachnospiraceae bacterium]|nr:N-acetyl-gamma-glutamyl-phosphate reductase [Lachnospiraceae bacterium]
MIHYSSIGATGYVSGELLRMMVAHPETELDYVADTFAIGTKIQDSHPQLVGFYDKEIMPLDDNTLELMCRDSDVVFIVAPSGEVSQYAEKIIAAGKVAIDIGADIRFRDVEVWEKWYGQKHPNPQLTYDAFYCIPEVFRKDFPKGQKLISNPGCYPTASTLGLYPMLKEGCIVDNTIVIDAKSGYTGAGRKPDLNKLLTEAENNFCAYALGGVHRHTPEIEQNIAYIQGKDLMKPETWQYINFQPHLLPQIRGIEVTIYATMNKDYTNEELYELYSEFYKDEPFVHVFPQSRAPQTKWVMGTNFCSITPTYDARTKRLIVSSVIDNIGKGAAGQAMQNMNLAFGLPETTGLMVTPMYP